MNTLPDVNTRRGGNDTSYAGPASDVFPEVQKSQATENSPTGVSVKFAQNPDKKWYVLRITYSRASKAYHLITKDKEEAYMPMRYTLKVSDGKKKRILTPLLPDILFVYATESYVTNLIKEKQSFITYYFDHFKVDEFGKNPPLTINYHEMMNFIRLTDIDNEHIKMVNASQCRYKHGDIVRIIDGEFKGIEGRVARVAGQQRVIVELTGLCLAATAYIPDAFIDVLK